jgi:hypothetical protein
LPRFLLGLLLESGCEPFVMALSWVSGIDMILCLVYLSVAQMVMQQCF